MGAREAGREKGAEEGKAAAGAMMTTTMLIHALNAGWMKWTIGVHSSGKRASGGYLHARLGQAIEAAFATGMEVLQPPRSPIDTPGATSQANA
jgi:hypothetical protein